MLDPPLVHRLLVGVERRADLAQRQPQLLLLVALHHHFRQRKRQGRKQRDDRDRHHQFDQREAGSRRACVHGATAMTCGSGTVAATSSPPGALGVMRPTLIDACGSAASASNTSVATLPDPLAPAPVPVTSSWIWPPAWSMVLTKDDCMLFCLRKLPSVTSTAFHTAGSKFTCISMRPSACGDCAFSVRLTSWPTFAWLGPCHDSTTGPAAGADCGGTSQRTGCGGSARAAGAAAADVLTATVPSGFRLNGALRRLDSVPAQYSTSSASGSVELPTMCGVIDSTISVFFLSVKWLENR